MNEWGIGPLFPRSQSGENPSSSSDKKNSDSPAFTKDNAEGNCRRKNELDKEKKENSASLANKQRCSASGQLVVSQAQALIDENHGFYRRSITSNSTRKKEESYIRSVLPRVFRREHTDIFTPSSRHSSIFLENALYPGSNDDSRKRRGSDASLLKYSNITVNKSDETSLAGQQQKEWKPTRPRREKTEGDIVMRRHRQELKETLEAKRPGVETRFSENTYEMKSRNSRILMLRSINLSTESEESVNQVSLLLCRLSISRVYLTFSFNRLYLSLRPSM